MLTNVNRQPPVAVLYGLGGVGKSQIAVEHALRHAPEDSVTWWINCENPSLIPEEFRSLARAVGISEADKLPTEQVIREVHGYLGKLQNDWLLVFDNANDVRQIRPYLPGHGLGRVIVTSLGRLSGELGEQLHVGCLDKEAGAAYLMRRAGSDDQTSAERLSDELGGLPLALVQAGSYIHEKHISIPRYLQIYNTHRLELLEDGSTGDDHLESVRTTWNISFSAIAKRSLGAAALLRICSFFAPDAIPLEVIREELGRWPAPLAGALSDDRKTESLVGELLNYSLIDRIDDDTLAMHRLVQLVVRDQLTTSDRSIYSLMVLKFMIDVFPREGWNETTWRRCERLVSHALSIVHAAEEIGAGPDGVANVYTSVARYFRSQSRFLEAAVFLETAYGTLESAYREPHLGLGMIANELGRVYQDLGRYSEAKDQLELGLAQTSMHFGEDHPNTAACHNNLGDLLRETDEISLAIEHLELAASINKTKCGPESTEYATSISNLAMTIRHVGEFERAGQLLKESLRIDTAKYGLESIQVAINFNNIGQLLKDAAIAGKDHETEVQVQEWLHLSEQYFQMALDIFELHHKTPNAQKAITLKNLGNLLAMTDRCLEARTRLESALEISVIVHPAGHPLTVEIRRNLANLAC